MLSASMSPEGESWQLASSLTPIGSPGAPGGGKTIVITAEVTAEAEAAAARSPLEDDEDGGVDTDDDDAKTAEAEAHADPG